jgi:ABC-2 type transport system ATP-binding protein
MRFVVETEDLLMGYPQQRGWRSLLKRQPMKVVLDRVNTSIERGEIFGIAGPNGAGKTTLVKVLSTLAIPVSGSAHVLGLDVVQDSIAVRRRIGVVYGDERSFFWRLSGFENLLFYASLYGLSGKEARRRVHELLELIGLRDYADLRMHHYSSGMKQRTAIARGLLNDPELLIMDEPTRTVDPLAAVELRALVKERVVESGRTVLLATNDMAEAEQLCDRVAFISHGKIQTVGTLSDLRSAFQADEVHQVIVSGLTCPDYDFLRDVVDSLEVVPLESGQQQLELRTAPGGPAVPVVVRRIVEAGGDIWSCSRKQLSMEEIFAMAVERGRVAAAEEVLV